MLIILYGFLIGCFVTLIGGGGATFYLGVLTSSLAMSTEMAVPTSLFIAVFALLSGFLTQLKLKNVDLRIGNRLIFAAIPGIIIGTAVSRFIPAVIYQTAIGCLLTFMGCVVLYKNLRKKKKEQVVNEKSKVALLFGLISGLMVGFGGLSGGSAVVAGLSIIGLPAVKATGTTTYILWVLAVVGLFSHLAAGSPISWTAGLFLMAGGIAGSVLTPLVLRLFDQKKLNKFLSPMLGFVIIYFGLNLIF
ncbi:sulfite exporter TauE/SafE family protein [Fructobacillus fructosus]|uniref:Probable membrane transporter protein n=1 Tax=Fructobacillus fructosus TaxID=1631 RepID=A0ABN9YSH9_9LACO|nr:sulfite exporter TauE/SafE family protein [Fructobacillus fructosus]MBD9365797.1 sulfite exporter TauE/SafE family protein [Leuconostoc mesenteroides]KRN52020.1 transport protein [Fructobacillus fructosus KCTC 3544]MBC9118975.1 sulfite exporter TauE/SafE family protein [Fructobacillus fructosus]MCK8638553.1 sulfite exporter TauE/SafE family protein [Fructobacillus fructosus]CAK1237971.1 Sulfite exporter TauE/SafE/YfcA and related permeases [Fructobacillus fructosus]